MSQKGKPPRKPRGLSGFVLLVLLISLFVWLLQSHADSGPSRSPYLFFRYLFAGKLDQVRIQDNRVEARVKPPSAGAGEEARAQADAAGRQGPSEFQVIFTSLDPALESLLRDVSAWAADVDESWAGGASGVQGFLGELEAGTVQVLRAWVLSARGKEPATGEEAGDQVYFVASSRKGQIYGKLQPEPRGGNGDLLAIIDRKSKSVKLSHGKGYRMTSYD